MRVCEGVEPLLLDDDLRRALNFGKDGGEGARGGAHDEVLWEQSGLRFLLAGGAYDAMRFPGFEFRIVSGVGIGGG